MATSGSEGNATAVTNAATAEAEAETNKLTNPFQKLGEKETWDKVNPANLFKYRKMKQDLGIEAEKADDEGWIAATVNAPVKVAAFLPSYLLAYLPSSPSLAVASSSF